MKDAKNNTLHTANSIYPSSPIEIELPLSPPKKGADTEGNINANQRLIPACPDSEQGYQPLSDFLVDRYTKRIIQLLRLICKRRGCEVDFDYWSKVTRRPLGCQTVDDVQLIPTRAGFGKSTWITALLLFFIELFQAAPEQAAALGGCALIVQKAETLNALAEELQQLAEELEITNPTPFHALQGWTGSARSRRLCLDPSVNRYEDCHREACAYAAECPVLNSVGKARFTPLIGLTQKRFYQIRERNGVPELLLWEDPAGVKHHRRFLIFDEKPEICAIHTLDQPTINDASTELNKLVQRRLATDAHVRGMQASLEYCISRPFRLLRSCLTIGPDCSDCLPDEARLRCDIPAGFCSLADLGNSADEIKQTYEAFSGSFCDERQKLVSQPLRQIFQAVDALVNGKSCLFTRQRGFAIHAIEAPSVAFEDSLTLIFDATAEVDADYNALAHCNVVSIPYPESKGNLRFHIYTDPSFNVSKSALKKPWAVQALSQKIGTIVEESSGGVFMLAYKALSAQVWSDLKEKLARKDCERVCCISTDGELSLPYFNGTNGSNNFNHCKMAILFGIPRLDPSTYLMRTCAAFGEDALREELEQAKLDLLEHGRGDFSGGTLAENYVARHLAARYEQEIYRTAIRNLNFTGAVDVHLFYPPPRVVGILKDRFLSGEFCEITEPLTGARYQRQRSRQFGDSPTSFHRLDDFLAVWDGSDMLVSEIKRKVSISESVWKDLRNKQSFAELMEAHHVIANGRGKNCKWKKECNNAVA